MPWPLTFSRTPSLGEGDSSSLRSTHQAWLLASFPAQPKLARAVIFHLRHLIVIRAREKGIPGSTGPKRPPGRFWGGKGTGWCHLGYVAFSLPIFYHSPYGSLTCFSLALRVPQSVQTTEWIFPYHLSTITTCPEMPTGNRLKAPSK